MRDEPAIGDVADIEFDAYVDGQLDLGRRFVVEDHLARHPALAARMMSDLRARSALQILLRQQKPASAAMMVSAGRLADAPRKRFWRRAMPVGGIAALGLSAIVAFLVIEADGPPLYVDHAVASHRTAMLRAAMVSQIESPRFDPHEIFSTTRIAMPVLPAGWRVTDVQLFPAGKGAALMIAVKTRTGEALSIFAMREPSAAPERPDAIREGAQSVAYWRRGEVSYALTGDEDPGAIDAKAEALAHLWNS